MIEEPYSGHMSQIWRNNDIQLPIGKDREPSACIGLCQAHQDGQAHLSGQENQFAGHVGGTLAKADVAHEVPDGHPKLPCMDRHYPFDWAYVQLRNGPGSKS